MTRSASSVFNERSVVKRFIIAILEKFIKLFLRTISISSIRCGKKKVAIEEGWGGKTIEHFPPYGFYRMFIEGNKAQAIEAMEKWYFTRFMEERLYAVSKVDGGMENGSLYRLVAKTHQDKAIELKQDFSNANESLIRQAIKIRVLERFALLESIQCGYKHMWDCITLRREGDHFVLINGHHRVAALAVCGHSSVKAATSKKVLWFSKTICRHLASEVLACESSNQS
jgi:hypothetical protein